MRFVIFNWLHPDDIAAYESLGAEEQEADIARHYEWFRRWGDRIVGGEELDEPRLVKTLRPGPQGEGIVVTDGPYVETKEVLGGFVVVEAGDMGQAIEMAMEWPSLSTQPKVAVQVQPVFPR